MTEARAKGERRNKVKLRGQKIPEINMARKVSFLKGQFLYSGGKKGGGGERKKKEKKKRREERTPPSPRLAHRPPGGRTCPRGRQVHSGGDPFAEQQAWGVLPSRQTALGGDDTGYFSKGGG